jgi:predicted metal-dependent TIM-barrel fold hydrolase
MAIPKAIREMRRRGIAEGAIRRVVFDNANEFYQLGLDGWE